MPNQYFQFKQFTVYQDKTAMKVGTDGVILGALAGLGIEQCGKHEVLDIGTGTGLVSLMIAQRFPNANITAVEIDPQASEQSAENFNNSPFASRFRVVNADIKKLCLDECFNFIVSNPPYFVDSLKAPDSQRSLARHTDSLSFDDLASSVNRFLSSDGIAVIIIPFDAADKLNDSFKLFNINPLSIINIKPNLNKPPKRSVITFSRKASCNCSASEIIIEQSPRVYTDVFRNLVEPFYLKL